MKNLIKSTNLKNAHVMNYFQAMSNINGFVQAENLEALHLTDVANVFKNQLQIFDQALLQARKTGLTEKLVELDEQRDQVLVGFGYIIKGKQLFPNDEVKTAAAQISYIIEKYGSGIQRLPQREETATLTNFVQDLNESKNAAAIAKLNVDEWVEALKKANEDFEKLYNERTEKEAEFVVGLTRKERESMQEVFVKLTRTIEAYAMIEGESPYKTLVDKINTEVAKVQQTIKIRQSK